MNPSRSWKRERRPTCANNERAQQSERNANDELLDLKAIWNHWTCLASIILARMQRKRPCLQLHENANTPISSILADGPAKLARPIHDGGGFALSSRAAE